MMEGVIEPIADIAGLHWQASFRCPNGGDAYAVRLPSMRPVTIGFHGPEPVEDGRLRLHVGTAHRLIFLGDPERIVRGHFIDCRKDSPTRRHRVTLTFHPDSARIVLTALAARFPNNRGVKDALAKLP